MQRFCAHAELLGVVGVSIDGQTCYFDQSFCNTRPESCVFDVAGHTGSGRRHICKHRHAESRKRAPSADYLHSEFLAGRFFDATPTHRKATVAQRLVAQVELVQAEELVVGCFACGPAQVAWRRPAGVVLRSKDLVRQDVLSSERNRRRYE